MPAGGVPVRVVFDFRKEFPSKRSSHTHTIELSYRFLAKKKIDYYHHIHTSSVVAVVVLVFLIDDQICLPRHEKECYGV